MNNVVDFNTKNLITDEFQDVVKRKEVDIHQFLSIPSVPVQRDTEGRANTNAVKKMLRNLHPSHLEVAIAVLTKTCTYLGKQYKKGSIFVVNGNTRQFYWKNALINAEPRSDKVPSKVIAMVYDCDSMEEAVATYHTYDSADATEKKMQKLYGVFRLFDFDPKSSKLQKGQVLSSLVISSFYFDRTRINQSTARVEDLPYMVKTWLPEMRVWDEVTKNPKNWDSALFAAVIMAMKKYGPRNEKILTIIDAIDNRKSNTESHKRTGRTHIVEEWKTNEMFPNKGTNWDRRGGGLKECVAFVTYWIEKEMSGELLSQPGFNWRQSADHYFDYMKALGDSLDIEDAVEA